MRAFIGLIKRNMLVYLKDKQTVFFSALTPLIVFTLYVLFLRGTFVSGLKSCLGDFAAIVGEDSIQTFANLILLAGVIGSSVITVSYSTLTTIVSDKDKRIDCDISATPISRPLVILAYVIAAFLNSFLVSSILLTGSLLVVSFMGNTYLTFGRILLLYLLTALGSLSATSFLMIITMLFKSSSSAGAFQGVLCAGVGFIIGAYIPISQFGNVVQTIANIFPGSHIAALFRNTLLTGVLEHMDTLMNGIDSHVLMESLIREFSLKLNMFGNSLPTYMNYVYVGVLLLITLTIGAVQYNSVYKRQ